MLVALSGLSPVADGDEVLLGDLILVRGRRRPCYPSECTVRVLQNQIEDVLRRDSLHHLGVTLDQVVHVQPGHFKLDLS